MDLLGRALIIAVVLALIIIGIFLYAQHLPAQQSITQQQAQSIVTSDIQQTYPDSLVNITQSGASTQYPGSWYMVASITTNASSPCPNYFIYTYSYPATGLVPDTQNTYTRGYASTCTVNSTIIGAEPVAVAKSYVLHDHLVDAYISKYGYSAVQTSAQYYSKLTVFNSNYTNVWLVKYSAPESQNSTYVVLAQSNGTDMLSYEK